MEKVPGILFSSLLCCIVFAVATSTDLMAQQKYSEKIPLVLQSPNGQIIFSIAIKTGYPSYSISYKGKILIEDSRLSLRFKETGEFGLNLLINNPEYRNVDELYQLVVGKTKTARNFCHEITIPLVEQEGPFRCVNHGHKRHEKIN